MDHEYKCTGSVVMWTLYNRLSRGFMVWMLAQKFDRKRYKRATGYVKDAFFLDWLTKSMSSTRKTTEKRLEEALQYGFLNECGKGKYLISSYRKMVEVAMDDQKRKYDECSNNASIPPPELLLKGDRKFTQDFLDWIDPKSVDNTINLLTGIASIQNSVNFRGKLNQGKLLNCHRNTIQRRNKKNNTKEFERFIIIDARRLLHSSDCANRRAIDIFREAERIYRRSNYLRGRQYLHRRLINGKYFLAIQIPSVCISSLRNMEAPSIRESVHWLHLKSGGRGHRTASLSLSDTTRLYESSSSLDGRKRLPLLVEWPRRFKNSKEMGCEVPDYILSSYLRGLTDILSNEHCRKHILHETNSTKLLPLSLAEPFVYVSDDATPSMEKEYLNVTRFPITL